jgi:hypothetical protein
MNMEILFFIGFFWCMILIRKHDNISMLFSSVKFIIINGYDLTMKWHAIDLYIYFDIIVGHGMHVNLIRDRLNNSTRSKNCMRLLWRECETNDKAKVRN